VKKQGRNYCCCCCCCCAGSLPNRDEEPRDEEAAAALGGKGPFLSAPSALNLLASELGFALRSPVSESAPSAAGSGGLTCCRSSSCGQRASWRRGSSSGRWERCSRQACSARNVLVSDEVQKVGCRGWMHTAAPTSLSTAAAASRGQSRRWTGMRASLEPPERTRRWTERAQ
jgi:hypothetical protein